jgi:hypothetical protein
MICAMRDAVLTIAGMLVFICGTYGLGLFSSWPYLLIPIFLLATAMGIVTLVREYQLWRKGAHEYLAHR